MDSAETLRREILAKLAAGKVSVEEADELLRQLDLRGRRGVGRREGTGNAGASLSQEFSRIKTGHRDALRRTAARLVLGPSVIRVYASGTNDAVRPYLSKIDIDVLQGYSGQHQFSAWFDEHLEQVAQIIDRQNPGNQRIRPGIKWGHSAKILALFCNALVFSSRYFDDATSTRIGDWVHVPIDNIIIERLNRLGFKTSFRKIKEIDTREKFYGVQDALAVAAKEHGVPRAWFDDNWADREMDEQSLLD